MPSYQDMVTLNNCGVAAFLQEDIPTAMALLRSALESSQIHSANDDHDANSSRQESTENSCGSERRSSTSVVSSLPSPSSCGSADASANTDQNCATFLDPNNDEGVMRLSSSLFDETPFMIDFAFIRPINLILSSEAYSQDRIVNLSVASAIIMFNMAIIYHLGGLPEDESNDRFTAHNENLTIAQRLYQHALKLLDRIPAFGTSTSVGNAVTDLITMAIHNNLAQAAFSFQNYQQSKEHCKHLFARCTSVRPEAYENHETAAILTWYRATFCMNILALYQPPPPAPTASAA